LELDNSGSGKGTGCGRGAKCLEIAEMSEQFLSSWYSIFLYNTDWVRADRGMEKAA
jgi:hypothetical protein